MFAGCRLAEQLEAEQMLVKLLRAREIGYVQADVADRKVYVCIHGWLFQAVGNAIDAGLPAGLIFFTGGCAADADRAYGVVAEFDRHAAA